jgi:hypothetical protein
MGRVSLRASTHARAPGAPCTPWTLSSLLPPSLQHALVPGARDVFLSGRWDATGLLLDRYEEVEAVGRRLPYVTGF